MESKKVHTGTRGGKFYYGPSGRKVYLSKEFSKPEFKTEYQMQQEAKDQTVYTGTRGGKYYLSTSGRKVYTSPKRGSSKTVQTGSKGGMYFLSPTGRKVYTTEEVRGGKTFHQGPRGGKCYLKLPLILLKKEEGKFFNFFYSQ